MIIDKTMRVIMSVSGVCEKHFPSFGLYSSNQKDLFSGRVKASRGDDHKCSHISNIATLTIPDPRELSCGPKNDFSGCAERLLQEVVKIKFKSRELFDANVKFSKYERSPLFIDLHRQNGDPFTFDEKEPGYYRAMTNAFERVRDILGIRLNADGVCALHDICVDGVARSDKKPPFEKGFSAGWCYGIAFLQVSEDAKKEWEEERLIWMGDANIPEDFLSHLSVNDEGPRICSNGTTREKVAAKINELLDNYYKQMSGSQTPDERLSAIVNLCRAIEIFHAFPDGNQRTIAFALLTKLLVENGFSPAMLDDPAMFDGYYSTVEMVDLIKKGQENYRNFSGQPEIAEAQYRLALLSEMDGDLEGALCLYVRSAQEGYALAQRKLDLLIKTKMITRNNVRLVNSSEALYGFARSLEKKGYLEKALNLYRQSAFRGYAPSQDELNALLRAKKIDVQEGRLVSCAEMRYDLAFLLENKGQFEEALNLYVESADQGYVGAQTKLRELLQEKRIDVRNGQFVSNQI